MKKSLVCLLTVLVAFLVCAALATTVFAANPAIKTDNKSVKAGETFSIDVNLENNPGIVLLKLNVTYDSQSLTLTGVSDAGKLAGWQTPSSTISSPYVLLWSKGDSTENFTTTGKIATLNFTAGQSAGSSNVVVTCVESYNVDLDDVTFTSSTSSVTVTVAPTGINVDKGSVSIDLAGKTTTDTVTATIAPQGATGTIKATSSDTKVATVTDAGVITGVKKGTATVTFKVDGTNITKTVAVTVTCSHKAQNTVDAKYLKSAGNCVEKAVYYQNCSACGEKLNTTFEGELDAQNHKGPINTVGAKTATHFEDGYTGDKVCSACKITTEKGQTITKGAHTWSTTYEHDENQHWQKCTSDEATTEKANHTPGDWEIVEAADIGKAGTKVKKCTVCGYEMASETIPALKDYTDTKTAEYKEEAPADVVINTKDGATAAPTAVTIGDKVLRKDTDYTVDGNKITIKQDVLKTLDNGSYNVEVTFADGVARAALTVTKATPVATTPATQTSNVPATGIESHLGLWIALLVLAASGIAVISFRKKESK